MIRVPGGQLDLLLIAMTLILNAPVAIALLVIRDAARRKWAP